MRTRWNWGSAGPSQSQTNQAMGYSRKNSSRGSWARTYFFGKIPGIFRVVALLLGIPEKTKLHLWKFQEIWLHPLEILTPSKNQDPLKFHMNFFITPENLTSFFEPCNFHVLFLHPIPQEIPFPQPCCLDFFWNSPVITELYMVVLFSQKYHWALFTLR